MATYNHSTQGKIPYFDIPGHHSYGSDSRRPQPFRVNLPSRSFLSSMSPAALQYGRSLPGPKNGKLY